MSGPIVAAVTRAIEEGAGEYWYIGVRAGTSHGFFVDYAQCIDRRDALIFRRLARGLPSSLAGMTMVEREDGSRRPMLISDPAWYEDRRKGARKGAAFRRGIEDAAILSARRAHERFEVKSGRIPVDGVISLPPVIE